MDKKRDINIETLEEIEYIEIDLKDSEKVTLILGEKIMLSQLMFVSVAYLNIAIPLFIPYDFSETVERIGWDEMDDIVLAVIR